MRFISKINSLFGTDIEPDATDAEIDATLEAVLEKGGLMTQVPPADTATDTTAAGSADTDADSGQYYTATGIKVPELVIAGPIVTVAESAGTNAPESSIEDMRTRIDELSKQVATLTEKLGDTVTQTQAAFDGLAQKFAQELNAIKVKSNEPSAATGTLPPLASRKTDDKVVSGDFISSWLN